jgi:hypothetical protein
MITVKRFILSLAIALVVGASVGALAFSSNGGALTGTRFMSCIMPDGTQRITYRYTNAAGRFAGQKTVILGATAGTPVVDDYGGVVSASTPSAALTARDSYVTALTSLEAAAAGANKLDYP